jgi:hypothetical protein
MIIHLKSHKVLGKGAYAHVFQVADRAFKLFLRFPEFPSKQTEKGRRETFISQCEAYQRASFDLRLRKHIADFYGACIIEDVLDSRGQSIKEEYLLDCCYVMKLLSGEDKKFTTSGLREAPQYLWNAYTRFLHVGINLGHSSIFNADDADRFKFIDFDLLW